MGTLAAFWSATRCCWIPFNVPMVLTLNPTPYHVAALPEAISQYITRPNVGEGGWEPPKSAQKWLGLAGCEALGFTMLNHGPPQAQSALRVGL